MNNAVFGKTIDNVKLVTLNLSQQTEEGINQYQNRIMILQGF